MFKELSKSIWKSEIIGAEITIRAEDVSTIAKAVTRTIPMQPLVFTHDPFMHYDCPVCGSCIRTPRTTPGCHECQQYCDRCGQKIDWGDVVDENT